jgi:uncharacterized protein YndB with AHSA1/START domain
VSNSEKQIAPVGTVAFEGEYATLTFCRRVAHPPEEIWSAITDPTQLRGWYMTRATIVGGKGGSIDFRSGPAEYHVTGRILSWDPPYLFEHEWNVEPSPQMPSGEESIVRWELAREGHETLVTLTHRRLTRRTAMGFGPGIHAFLDCLTAHLDGEPMPDWMSRVGAVRRYYPPWSSSSSPPDNPSGQKGQDA